MDDDGDDDDECVYTNIDWLGGKYLTNVCTLDTRECNYELSTGK